MSSVVHVGVGIVTVVIIGSAHRDEGVGDLGAWSVIFIRQERRVAWPFRRTGASTVSPLR